MSTMATPDGRNAFEPLAEGCSPAHNSDKNGPTAVFKSVSKLRTNKITGGVLLNQKMTPQMLSTEENRQKLELLIKTFFNRLHGYHVQYNIVSKETLIDAQKHLVLEAAHPSPLARGAFFGCRHFSKANSYLAERGKDTIDWKL